MRIQEDPTHVSCSSAESLLLNHHKEVSSNHSEFDFPEGGIQPSGISIEIVASQKLTDLGLGSCLLLSQREGHVHVESSDRADEEGGDSELHGEFS